MAKLRATEREPDSEGLAPVLESGEFCRDRIHKMYHFRTPDDEHFALGNKSSRSQVFLGTAGITIAFPPEYCGSRKGVLRNRWTVKNGAWVEI